MKRNVSCCERKIKRVRKFQRQKDFISNDEKIELINEEKKNDDDDDHNTQKKNKRFKR